MTLPSVIEAVWPEAVKSIAARSSVVVRVVAILNGDESGATPDEAARVRELAKKPSPGDRP